MKGFIAKHPAALALCSAMLVVSLAAAETPAADPAYFALKPSIVSNLTGGPKYIRCDIQLMTTQPGTLPTIELHSPALRHAILMLIAGEDGNQLKTREGKETLRTRALGAVQEQLQALAGEPMVSDLYFTNYYVK